MLLTATLLAFVTLSGCSPVDGDDQPAPEPPTTAAATMRATLERLFREHVFLLGDATENLITGQGNGFEAASAALEENTLALADRFERTYAARGERGFLTVWRPYIELSTLYAGRLARKQPMVQADAVFERAASGLGKFAFEVSLLNNARLMTTQMSNLIASMRAAVDAQVGKDFKKADLSLRTAGDRAAELGVAFARTFADDSPVLYPGDPRSPSATLRAALVSPLVEHVYLVGLTTENILTGQSAPRDGAKAALDAASAAFAKQMGATYGPEAEPEFLAVWKQQTDLLISYANAAKDAAKRDQIAAGLEQYATDAAGYLVGLNRALDRLKLERILGEHGQAMTQVIDAQAAGDHNRAELRLRSAAEQVDVLATALAVAAVKRFPVRFRPTPADF